MRTLTSTGRNILLGVALLIALVFIVYQATAQSRVDVFPEANVTWTNYTIRALEDGGVTIAGCGRFVSEDAGVVTHQCTDEYHVTGATRTSAKNFGNGAVTTALKKTFGTGSGANP